MLSNGVAAAFHAGSEIAVVATATLVVLAGLILRPLVLGFLLFTILTRTSQTTQNCPASGGFLAPELPPMMPPITAPPTPPRTKPPLGLLF